MTNSDNKTSKKETKNVLVYTKMTELEFDKWKYGDKVDEFHERCKVDVKALQENHNYHYACFEKTIKLLREYNREPKTIVKQNADASAFKNKYDEVYVVGGDGTFMDGARYILDDTLIIGVKSSPKSVGWHMTATAEDIEEKIKRIDSGDYFIEKRARIQATIHNDKNNTDYALNDILIGDMYLPGFAKLDVYFNGKMYHTGSSGILISTYQGSTGMYNNLILQEKDRSYLNKLANDYLNSLGYNEEFELVCNPSKFKKEDLENNILRYKTFAGNINVPENLGYEYGILKAGDELRIVSNLIVDGAVHFDGNKKNRPNARAYDLAFGNEVIVKMSDKPLHVINFK